MGTSYPGSLPTMRGVTLISSRTLDALRATSKIWSLAFRAYTKRPGATLVRKWACMCLLAWLDGPVHGWSCLWMALDLELVILKARSECNFMLTQTHP